MKNNEITLDVEYGSVKSFYGKATYVKDDNIVTLYSYDTKVLVYDTKNQEITYNLKFSTTTARHKKEFLLQMGFRFKKSGSIEKQIEDSMEENENNKNKNQ